MGIISWIIFGGLAGWVASMITGRNDQMGCLANIVAGVVGAFVGGAIYRFFTGNDFTAGFDITSFIVAVVGAVLVLLVLNLISGRR
jgi:uncharacterized membrane protein YeaQ/YmgE (transglycosylase-associated protein family)